MTARWVAFHVTDRCNLNCQHCLRDPTLQPKDLPLELISSILDQAHTRYGIDHVALTGGEPTLHPAFEAIVDAIADRGMSWHMVSNASRVAELMTAFAARPARREALTMLDFSLDGATEAVHDSIRGHGSYREVMRGVALATAHGVPFMLQMVVNARNVHEIEPLAIAAAQLGAKRVSFAWLQATGTHLDRELFVPASEWPRIMDRIDRIASILAIPVSMPEGFPKPQAFSVCEPFRSATLHVDVEGRLNLCCQHSGTPSTGERTDVAASLRETSLMDAHLVLLDIIHATQRARLEAIQAGTDDVWDAFPCNWCMKHFGKPHWADDGGSGASARRDRWRGAWAGGAPGSRDPRRLPVVG